MKSVVITLFIYSLCLPLWISCGPGNVNLDKYKGPQEPPRRDIEKREAQIVRKYFLNDKSEKTGNPNVIEYLKIPNSDSDQNRAEPRLTRKVLDMNVDGRPDIVKYYNKSGRETKAKEDLNLDGSYDVVNHFNAEGQIAYQQVLSSNGDVRLTRHYRNGNLERVEKDENDDGKTDYWATYGKKGELLRIGKDTNQDGEADKWIKP